MIAKLTGTVLEANYTELILDVHGIGFKILIPISTFDALPRAGEQTSVLTYMQVREDDISLFGFATQQEKAIFELLITVNGIGAKTALNILSSMNIPAFCAALASGDVKALKRINGVGPKSAERMIVELRDKIDKVLPGGSFAGAAAAAALPKDAPGAKELEDALLALEKLGFQRAKIEKLVAEITASLPEGQRSTENIIRKSLFSLNR